MIFCCACCEQIIVMGHFTMYTSVSLCSQMWHCIEGASDQHTHPVSNQGGKTSSKERVKKLHSILRYVESSRGFTEIKQVSPCSIQVCRGSIDAWNTFVLRIEHPYIVRNPWIWVSPPSMLRKMHVANCSRKPKCIFSFSTANYYLKL